MIARFEFFAKAASTTDHNLSFCLRFLYLAVDFRHLCDKIQCKSDETELSLTQLKPEWGIMVKYIVVREKNKISAK